MRARSVSLVVSCLMALGAGFPALAADDGSSSMDSIWLDAPQPAPAGETPNPAAASTKPATTTAPSKSTRSKANPKESADASATPSLKAAPALETSAAASGDGAGVQSGGMSASGAVPGSPAGTVETQPNTVAPMVTLDYFKTSSLVTKGGWPGVGPFKEEGSPLDLSDPNGNRLKVDVNGTQVTRAELNLQKPSGDFLDVEMNADFLLESVGVKPKKIVEFNEQLEKNRNLVTKGDGMPNMTVGRYIVAIQRTAADASTLAISVNSLDADRSALQAHSVLPETTQPGTGSKIAGIFGLNKPSQTPAGTVLSKASPGKTTPPTKTVPTKTSGSGSTGNTTTATASAPSSTGSSASGGGDLKESFQTLVRNWQNLKKTAVRQKQTSDLAQFLAGQALSRQTTAIKWLVDNKQYYDITPQSVVVEKIAPAVPGHDKKYLVQTVIKEHSKRCEDSGKVVLDKDDTYKVNYTIEKIGDRWFIVDSAVPSSTAKPAAGGKTGR